MTYPDHPMGHPTDGVAVRPGTSDALTARTIDATVHPPLVRAKETVVGIVPRVAEAAAPLTSPLFLGALALTLTFVLVARRMRYRPSALVLGALLIVTLSSFHPMQKPQPRQFADSRRPRTTIGAARVISQQRDYMPPTPPEPPTPPTPVDAPTPVVDVRDFPAQVFLPPDLVERVHELSGDALQSAGRMMRDNEHMRQMVQDIRRRLREEARRQHWRQMIAERQARSREFDLIDSP